MLKKIFAILAVSFMSVTTLPLHAQDQPVSLVIGFSAGGGSDRIVKQIQQVLETAGKKVVIEYRPGAGGTIAARSVATDRGSDLKFYMVATPNIVAGNLEPHDHYNYQDLRPSVYLGYVPMLLVSHKDYGVTTLDQLLTSNKPEPRYGSSGVGSGTHISGELFFANVKKTMIHVPYKGAGKMLPDLVAGRVDVAFAFPKQVEQHIAAGTLTALAVAGSRRLDKFASVPTLDEKQLPDAYAKLMYVLFANPGADANQVKDIQSILKRAWQDPAVQGQFRENADLEIEPARIFEHETVLKSEFQKYRKLAETSPQIVTKK
jgi:tripartite-type tricarboxylate transporter receptor subunit TctC